MTHPTPQVPLPCPVERIWSMHPEGAGAGLSGLILQRAATGGETSSADHAVAARADDSPRWDHADGGDVMGDATAHEPGAY